MVVRKWKDLNPKLQRLTVVAGALAAISAVVLLLPSGKSTGTERQSNQDVIKHVLTDRDTRTVGLESLAAAIKDIQSKVTDQSRQMKKMERDLDLAKKQQNSVPPIVNSQMERLTTQIERMKEDIEKAKDAKRMSRLLRVVPRTADNQRQEMPRPVQRLPHLALHTAANLVRPVTLVSRTLPSKARWKSFRTTNGQPRSQALALKVRPRPRQQHRRSMS